MIAEQKSCIHASAVAVFVEWWIVVFVDNACVVPPSLAGPDGFRLQETVWSQLQGVGGSTQEFVRSSL